MSRSRRKSPICGLTIAESEKQDKRLYNRRYRRLCKVRVHTNPDDPVLPDLREVSDVWAMDKDGKRWFDARRQPKLMRK